MTTTLSKSLEQTEKIAAEFASSLKIGDVVGLCGELGGGKTTFVRGVVESLGGDPELIVTSPTFTLMQDYPSPKGTIYHFDLYRLNSYQEFINLDFEEYFEKGICFIEWADKFRELDRLITKRIRFKIMGDDTCRRIDVNLLCVTKIS